MFQKLLAKKLDKEEVERLVQEEKDYILKTCQPRAIFLFGSAARDEMTEASDLDFLVVVRDGADLKEIKHRYYCSPRERKWPVDLVFLDQSSFDEKSHIGGVAMICLQEGRLLFQEPS